MDNFDKRMAAIEPAVTMKVPNKLGAGEGGEQLGVNLKFSKMDDFSPAAIARQVPAMAKLLQAREQLSNLMRYMDGKVAAEDTLKKLLADPELMAAMKEKLAEKPEGDNELRGNRPMATELEKQDAHSGAVAEADEFRGSAQAKLQDRATSAPPPKSRSAVQTLVTPGARRLRRSSRTTSSTRSKR